ncbi:MAG TPA: glycosyltransferase family 4 protein, partial [Hyphomicrobiaceae bacterium]|nr:glycosyltransferase family 4 protein [Hyphomicrobiaceae bacterium]
VGIIVDSVASDPLTERRLAEIAPALSLGILAVPMSREIGLSDYRAFHLIRRRALALQCDVLHGHGAKGGAFARLVAQSLIRSGRPVIAAYTPHGGSLHFHPSTLKGRVYMALERYLAGLTHGIVFESAYSAETFASHVGTPHCPARVIPNGLADTDFEPVPHDSDAADVLFVGELRHLKGVDILLEAVARLPEARAVIVGAGPDRAQFEADVLRLGISSRVTFAGAMPAREAFRRGRILVMPSRAESFPYIALEAAAAALPLVATSVGGVPEIVAGTDTRLVPPGDASALAEALRIAIAEPDLMRARAERLRASVASRFTVARMADGVGALYAATGRTPLKGAPRSIPRPA